MITCWYITRRTHDLVALEAEAHGRVLHVERRKGERAWRWVVKSAHGQELAAGAAPERERAESAAEDEAYRAHPPVGDVVAYWSD